MSPYPTELPEADAGFSLVEVLVGLLLVALVGASTLTVFTASARAALGSRIEAQANDVLQSKVESLRNMPFYVAYDASAPTSKIDLLDSYYPDATTSGNVNPASVAAATAGYVALPSPSPAASALGEPAPPFYRTKSTVPVNSENPSASNQFSVLIDTQFVNQGSGGALTARAPYAGYRYDSTTDIPAAESALVTVIVQWSFGGKTRTRSAVTQVSMAAPVEAQTTGQVRLSALKARTTLASQAVQTLEVASLSADGSVSTNNSAGLTATGAAGSVNGGSTVKGAAFDPASLSSPGTEASADKTGTAKDLSAACAQLCFGTTTVRRGAVTTAGGLPVVGVRDSAAVLQSSTAELDAPTTAGRVAAFSATPDSAVATPLLLDPSRPAVQVFNSGTSNPTFASGVSLETTGSSSHRVAGDLALTAPSTTVGLLPTAGASAGMVQVKLTALSVSCSATGSSAGPATATWTGHVDVFNPMTGALVWSRDFSNGTPLPATSTVSFTVNGSPVTLDRWLDWSTLNGTPAERDPANKSVRSASDGVFSALTVPLRADQSAESALAVQLGAFACYAEDNR